MGLNSGNYLEMSKFFSVFSLMKSFIEVSIVWIKSSVLILLDLFAALNIHQMPLSSPLIVFAFYVSYSSLNWVPLIFFETFCWYLQLVASFTSLSSVFWLLLFLLLFSLLLTSNHSSRSYPPSVWFWWRLTDLPFPLSSYICFFITLRDDMQQGDHWWLGVEN